MSKQPKALLLANILEHRIPSIDCLEIASKELRRLHEVNQDLLGFAETVSQLVIIPPMMTQQAGQLMMLQDMATAAIAKATGEQP